MFVSDFYSGSLTGRYFVQIQEGTLCLDFDCTEPELWLENRYGVFRLSPFDADNSNQQSFEFDMDFMIGRLAEEHGKTFTKTIECINRFDTDKQALATFCIRYGEPALQLLDDSPAIAFLMARDDFFSYGDDRRIAGKLVSPLHRRSAILKSYGYPGSASTAKLFRKIPVAECCPELFGELRDLLLTQSPEVMKLLRHARRINHLLVKLLALENLVPFLSESLITEASETPLTDGKSQFYSDLVDIHCFLSESLDAGFQMPPLLRLSDLGILHDQMIGVFRERRSLDSLVGIEFPPAPFSVFEICSELGTSRITPLETAVKLWDEGRLMHHCIAGYADMISKEKSEAYAYHLELDGEEEATMLIHCYGGKWTVQEIKGFCNAEVSKNMLVFADKWLEEQEQLQKNK